MHILPPFFRTFCLSILVMLVTVTTGLAAGKDLKPADIIAALKEGGHVVYFRHGATTWSGVDQLHWPREEQRLLSELGIAESEQIGAGFKSAQIPVGDVLSSPFARCADMAQIAFGKVDITMDLIGLLSDANGREARVDYLKTQLSTPPTNGNRILISHTSNIAQAAGVRLREGDAVIVKPQGNSFEILGIMAPGDW